MILLPRSLRDEFNRLDEPERGFAKHFALIVVGLGLVIITLLLVSYYGAVLRPAQQQLDSRDIAAISAVVADQLKGPPDARMQLVRYVFRPPALEIRVSRDITKGVECRHHATLRVAQLLPPGDRLPGELTAEEWKAVLAQNDELDSVVLFAVQKPLGAVAAGEVVRFRIPRLLDATPHRITLEPPQECGSGSLWNVRPERFVPPQPPFWRG